MATVVCFSCKKNQNKVADYSITDSTLAHIKIIDASDSFRKVTKGMPDSFNVYVNGERVTSSTSAPAVPSMTFGAIFPGLASAGSAYLTVSPGSASIRLSYDGVVNADSVTILSLTKTLVPGGYYTFMITDSLLSTRDSNRIFVRDYYKTPVPGYVNLRFINAVINDTAGKTVDLWSYARNAAVLTKIKPDSVTSFQSLGINSGVSDTFYVRRTGTTLNLAKLLFPPVGQTASQRTYTLFYYGDGNLTGTAKKARTLGYYNH